MVCSTEAGVKELESTIASSTALMVELPLITKSELFVEVPTEILPPLPPVIPMRFERLMVAPFVCTPRPVVLIYK